MRWLAPLPLLVLGLLPPAPPPGHGDAAAAQGFDPFTAAGLAPKLGARVPGDLRLVDESGAAVTLGRYLGRGRPPVILAPVDYDCGHLCGVSLGDLFGALDALPFAAGEAFEVVAVGIDPRDGPALAASAKAEHLRRYRRPGAAAAVHFLTDPGGNAAVRLARTIGFRYRYDPHSDQYAHAIGAGVLTPDGRLARWLYGFPYEPADLRLALAAAGRGGIGALADRLWLLCYHYDPARGSYGLAVNAALTAGGTLTCLALAGLVLGMLRRERRHGHRDRAP